MTLEPVNPILTSPTIHAGIRIETFIDLRLTDVTRVPWVTETVEGVDPVEAPAMMTWVPIPSTVIYIGLTIGACGGIRN